jgi:hypothetical protein
MAQRILAGEQKAFTEALIEFNPFSELSTLGSSIHFTVHSAKVIECVLKVNGKHAIPTEIKTLTSTGKLSIKQMPKGKFQEIYSDYVCACVLRIGRELFALFPIDITIITAVVDSIDTSNGKAFEQPILSVAMTRSAMNRIDFNSIDPSDSMANFLHRGDFKINRKSEVFIMIEPLILADVIELTMESVNVDDLLAKSHKMRTEILNEIEKVNRLSSEIIIKNSITALQHSLHFFFLPR